MIKAVRCDKESFREVRFNPGFNVILAERLKESTKKDSRNGLGKTTLIEIIHFCLGATAKKNEGLLVKELENWTFILDLTLKNKDYSIYRNTLDCNKIEIEGDVSDWPIKPTFDHNEEKYVLTIKEWNTLLGYLMFAIPGEDTQKKYSPTFRSLISYFMRRGTGGYSSPFKHYPLQKEWDIQVHNAFLLGLNREYAAEFQELKDNENTLKELKRAANQGLLSGYVGSIGELEAERIRLEDNISRLTEELKSFKVHPQYFKIQEEANHLTKEIHDISNRLTIDKQLLSKYRESIVQEKDISTEKVKQVYVEAGLVFHETLLKRLDDVSDFHKNIIENRKEYLKAEIERLAREIAEQESKIEQLSCKRAELLEVLKTHGALEEYTKLQGRAAGMKQQLEEIKNRKENLKRFEEGKNSLRIAKAELFQKSRLDFQERMPHVETAVKLFNKYSEGLYNEPGALSIDVTETGYKYKVEIKRAGSQGIGYMKVFCYDLTLAGLLLESGYTWNSLIHDSTIFDGVDERQIAKALELAASEAEEQGIQYICALNSDNVPYDDFSEGFRPRFDEHVVITFTDATDGGGLLGIRF
jgi:uncharacterized protein YydD (DUF2326 family)